MSVNNNSPLTPNRTFLNALQRTGQHEYSRPDHEKELDVLKNIREALILGMSQAHQDSVHLSNQIAQQNPVRPITQSASVNEPD